VREDAVIGRVDRWRSTPIVAGISSYQPVPAYDGFLYRGVDLTVGSAIGPLISLTRRARAGAHAGAPQVLFGLPNFLFGFLVYSGSRGRL
jgi:hypothetical protein